MNPVAQYVLSLATCVIGYFAYLKFAVPLIENPSVVAGDRPYQRSNVSIPRIHKNGMIPLLPPQAWELNDCKTLITSTGTVLFKEVVPQSDGTVKLSPFTLMTNVGENILLNPAFSPAMSSQATGSQAPDQKIPLVLRTAEGAVLKLNKPFSEAFQGGTEIRSARLVGEVDIYRPPSGPNKNDVLHVLTRNVKVDRNRIYTLDTLLFSYGPHRGRGRNLNINLIHSENSVAGKQDFSTISGIRQFELAYLDRLRIVPSAAKPTAAIDGSGNQPDSQLFGGQDAPLEVSCEGPCMFDFAEQMVSFSKQVVVKKISPTPDSITCEQLRIKFTQNPLATTANDQPNSPQPNEPKQELGIESLVAEGTPVIVNAISRPAKITAGRLTYNALTDVITAIPGPNTAGTVTLVTPEIQYKTEQLSCKLATAGGKKTLDALSASGPGQLLKLGKTPKEEMFVSWTKSLNTARDPRDPSIQTLVLKGSPHVQFQETSSIDAERIDLMLKRFETSNGDKVQTEFAVMEVVATQNVRIATPDIAGKTDRLIAEFPKPLKLKPHRVGRPSYPAIGDLQLATGINATPNPVQPRTPVNNWPNFGGVIPKAAPPVQAKLSTKKQLIFSGQQVRISILEATGDDLSFDELIINGDVSVSQKDSKDPDSSKTFELQGDHLRLVPQAGEDRFRVELSSNDRKATINSPEFTITGQKINFDQVDNKLWVEGPGQCNFDNREVTIKPPARVANRGGFSQSATLGPRNSPAQNVAKFEASWQGGMIFDGRKIYLERDVISKTEQFDGKKQTVTQANCGQMSVALNRYVDFEQLKQNGGAGITKPQDIKPTELIFIDQVDPLNQVFGQVPVAPNFKPSPPLIFNRFFDASGNLLQQQTISSKKVRVDPVSKNIFADGEGWFSTHDLRTPSRNNANRHSAPPLAGLAGKRNDASKPITFVRANFSGQMKVEAAKNQMTISDRVRTVHLQTDDWRTNADPDRIPPELQPTATSLTSERLTLARWQPRDAAEPTHEMIADGNVRIFGDTIDLSANRVSYNQVNDMLVVNGTTRTAANIRYQEGTGRARSWQEFSAEKFEYQISSQSVNVSGVRKGEAIRID